MVVLDHPIHYLKRAEKVAVIQYTGTRHDDDFEAQHYTGHEGTKKTCNNKRYHKQTFDDYLRVF